MARLFGTDGVRGVANKDLSAELALRLGWAGASILTLRERGKILIGRDTRISGEMLEAAMVAGITSTGAEAVNLGVLPTGAIALLIKKMGADAGVVISASHNPYEYNGIKFFNSEGFKLSDDDEDRIEILVRENNCTGPIGAHIGRHAEAPRAADSYITYCTGLIKNRFASIKIVIDCANGAAFHVAPEIFSRLGAEVIPIAAEPDGVNINDHCGSTHPDNLQAAVLENNADLGLAFDGDADRLIAVDEHGSIVDGDFIIAACAVFMKEQGLLLNDRVVTTVMTNLGFMKVMREKGIEVIKTKVGDRYVLEEMINIGANLGGEQSGHVIFLDDSPAGDGLITGLHLIDILNRKSIPMSAISGIMERMPQVLLNVTVAQKEHLNENERIWKLVRNEEELLGENGRILVRPSGTEPLVRVMVEAEDSDKANQIAETIAEVVEQELG